MTHPMFANIVYDLVIDGGPIMWPILACFGLALVVVLERALWWAELKRRSRLASLPSVFDAISEGRFEDALEQTADASDPFRSTLHEGLTHAHASFLGAMQLRATDEIERAEKRLWILSALITLAPLLGLLGTVVGIMGSFQFVGSEELAATKVSGGIAEALIATASGLAVAILCLLPFHYFQRAHQTLQSRLERVINHVELLVESAKHHGHDLESFARRRSVGERDEDPKAIRLSL